MTRILFFKSCLLAFGLLAFSQNGSAQTAAQEDAPQRHGRVYSAPKKEAPAKEKCGDKEMNKPAGTRPGRGTDSADRRPGRQKQEN